MKKTFAYLTLLLGVIFSITPMQLSAQQNPDVEVWHKEYESRFANRVKQRTEQKPNFSEDLKFSNPDYVVFVPSVEPEKLGDSYNDHFQVFDKPNGIRHWFTLLDGQ